MTRNSLTRNSLTRNSLTRLLMVSVSLCALLAVATAAHAQGQGASPDGQVLLEDNFQALDPGWGTVTEFRKVAGNKLQLINGPNQFMVIEYQGDVYDDANITIKTSMAQGSEGSYGGLVFWAAGYGDYFLLAYDDVGDACVMHVVRDRRTVYPMTWRHIDEIKKEAGQWNELRVETRGATANVVINGKRIATIKGRPPQNGSYIGVYAQSGTSGGATWEYKDLKVTAPADKK